MFYSISPPPPSCQAFFWDCQIKIKNGLFFNDLKFKSGLPKTVKRYNLELKPKEKRGSKLCLNNYIKILQMSKLNHS